MWAGVGPSRSQIIPGHGMEIAILEAPALNLLFSKSLKPTLRFSGGGSDFGGFRSTIFRGADLRYREVWLGDLENKRLRDKSVIAIDYFADSYR